MSLRAKIEGRSSNAKNSRKRIMYSNYARTFQNMRAYVYTCLQTKITKSFTSLNMHLRFSKH